MAFPFDGQPNLRPGAERDPFSHAPRYDPTLSLDDLFEDFLAGSATLIGSATERVYKYDWSIYRRWLTEANIAPVLGSVNEQHFVEYIAYLQRRPKQKGTGTLSSHSVHHYVRVIRTFVRWLVAKGYYTSDPFAGGGRGIMPRQGLRVLKTAQVIDVEMLLKGSEGKPRSSLEAASRGRDGFVIMLVTDTGMRTSEVAHLDVGSIDTDSGWVLLRETKWDRQRRVPLSRETIASLRVYLRQDRPILSATRPEAARHDDPLIVSAAGTRLTPQGIYQAMGRAYRRGGGTGGFGLHRLRHLFGTTAAERGMHPLISQLIMGHEDPKSQQIYQNPSDASIKREHGNMTPIHQLGAARRRRLA